MSAKQPDAGKRMARAARAPAPGRAAAGSWLTRLAASRAALPLFVALCALLARAWLEHRLGRSLLGGSFVADSQTYWDWAGLLLRGEPGAAEPYFLGPLYPYALAAIRKAFGNDWLSVARVQGCFGALGAALLADAGRRLASPLAGLLAGLLAAGFAPLVLHDQLVLSESLLFLLGAVWVWVATAPEPRLHPYAFAVVLGALVGAMALGRGTQLALLATLPLLPALGATLRARALGTALAALAALAMVAPATRHNLRATGEIIPITYSAGYNLAAGFGPGASGGFVPPTGTSVLMSTPGTGRAGGVEWDGRDEIERRTGRKLTPLQSSAWWSRVATEAIRADPVRALKLTGLKALMLWNRREYPQIENLRTYERVLGPVGLPSVLVIPLAVALAFAALGSRWRSDARVRWLAAVAAVQTLVLLPFFVTDRYRLHLLPALFVLAAAGFEALRERFRQGRRGGPVGNALPAMAIGLVLALLPLPGQARNREDWGVAMDLGERALLRGRYAEAVGYLSEAAAIERREGREWERHESMRVPLTAHAYALGRALVQSGQGEAARPWLERSRRLSPSLPGLESWLARLEGGTDAALPPREQAIRLAQTGRFAEAESLFARLARSAPEGQPDEYAWAALVRLQAQSGRGAAARATLDEGQRAGWRGPSAEMHAALVLALEGHTAEAKRRLGAIDNAAVRHDPVLADLDAVVRRVLADPHP